MFFGQNGRALTAAVKRNFVVLLALWAAATVAAVAGGSQASPAAPVPKPLVPAAANSIVANPDSFIGQTVTVTAAIEQVVSATAFTVDQNAQRTADELLVIVPVLNAPLALNSYVTIIGEVVRHEGRPAIRATSVLTAGGADLANRIPPPMTADEAAFDKVMKSVNRSFAALRQIVGAAGGGNAAPHAAALKQGFAETEAFWKKRGNADAEKWAADARAGADALERAIAAAKWDEAKTSLSSVQQTCAACHGAYRERGDDGSYRIRGN